jgi:hypothetical protein
MIETFNSLMMGFSVAFQPQVLMYAFFGCIIGTLVGMMPGLGPLAGISLLLPATFGLNPIIAIVLLAGVYYGAMYGGSTTSILMRIPGEAASVMTCVDGYAMTQQGRAGPALAIAAKPIDAIVQILDNQSSSGFTAIVRAAVRARKPLFSFIESGVRQGAAVGVTMSYHQAGYEAAMMVARIMRGESPATIPFARPGQVRLIVSEENARRLGMSLPAELVQRADVRLESPH